jgi:sulfur transfer protein SufE
VDEGISQQVLSELNVGASVTEIEIMARHEKLDEMRAKGLAALLRQLKEEK